MALLSTCRARACRSARVAVDLMRGRHLQVRNSAGGIVQLSYGEDNLDPVAMEDAGGKPINLPRSLSVVHASLPQQPRIPENASDEGDQGSLNRQFQSVLHFKVWSRRSGMTRHAIESHSLVPVQETVQRGLPWYGEVEHAWRLKQR